jgi:hypothetical protein
MALPTIALPLALPLLPLSKLLPGALLFSLLPLPTVLVLFTLVGAAGPSCLTTAIFARVGFWEVIPHFSQWSQTFIGVGHSQIVLDEFGEVFINHPRFFAGHCKVDDGRQNPPARIHKPVRH